MARRTVTVTLIQYSEKHKRGKTYFDVSVLPDRTDLLHRLHGLFLGIAADALVDDAKKSYAKVIALEPEGRTLLVTLEVGPYGEMGKVRRVTDHAVQHSHGGDEAHVIEMRALFVVPEKSTSALMFVEHAQGRSSGRKLLTLVRDAWMSTFSGHTLHASTITRTDAWLEQAQLEAVTAVVYGHETDLADAGLPKSIGDLTWELRPSKGSRFLPSALWEALRTRRLERAKVLGIPNGLEPNEIKVQLGDGDQTKTFLIDREGTPAVKYLLCDDGEPVPDAAEFRDFCLKEVQAEAFTSVGIDWQTAQGQGAWNQEALAVSWETGHG